MKKVIALLLFALCAISLNAQTIRRLDDGTLVSVTETQTQISIEQIEQQRKELEIGISNAQARIEELTAILKQIESLGAKRTVTKPKN